MKLQRNLLFEMLRVAQLAPVALHRFHERRHLLPLEPPVRVLGLVGRGVDRKVRVLQRRQVPQHLLVGDPVDVVLRPAVPPVQPAHAPDRAQKLGGFFVGAFPRRLVQHLVQNDAALAEGGQSDTDGFRVGDFCFFQHGLEKLRHVRHAVVVPGVLGQADDGLGGHEVGVAADDVVYSLSGNHQPNVAFFELCAENAQSVFEGVGGVVLGLRVGAHLQLEVLDVSREEDHVVGVAAALVRWFVENVVFALVFSWQRFEVVEFHLHKINKNWNKSKVFCNKILVINNKLFLFGC